MTVYLDDHVTTAHHHWYPDCDAADGPEDHLEISIADRLENGSNEGLYVSFRWTACGSDAESL